MSRTLHTPQYLLRRNIILHRLGSARGSFVEFGCGRGDLLVELAKRGFSGVGVEIGAAARAAAEQATVPWRDRVRVIADTESLVDDTFDFVFNFEVLEHLEDDVGQLARWAKYLTPGGRLLLTVPAHMSSWTAADDAVGHVRRYERAEVLDLARRAGLEPIELWTYGFPVTALTRRLRQLSYRSRVKRVAHLSAAERSLESSFDSTRAIPGAAVLGGLMDLFGWAAHVAQLPFRGSDLGDGYLLECRRS